MIKKKYRIASLSYGLLESFVTALSFLIAYYLRWRLPGPLFAPLFPFRDYLGLLGVVLFLWLLIFFLIRQQQSSILPADFWKLFQETFLVVILGTVLISAAIFVLKLDYISRPFILIFAGVNLLFLTTFRSFARKSVHLFHNLLENEKNILIVGGQQKTAEVASVLKTSQQWGYRIVGVAAENDEEMLDPAWRNYPRLPLAKVGETIRNRIIDEVIFAVSLESLRHMEELFLICEEEGVKSRVMLNFFPHVTSKVYLEALHELPLLTFTTTPQNEYLLFFKNAFDLIFSALALFVLFPLLASIALLIKLTSGGPVIFKQVRSGLGGRKFVLYKFRTMVLEAEELKQQINHLNEMSGPVFKIKEDPRCTPFGRWLRKFSLDELPQFFNILKGDMSFVGPRPPLPEEVEQYERWQRRRLRMKPGLSCLWQIGGRSQVDFEEWMRLDLEYIDNWSLLLDLTILLKTIPIVLLGRGAH
jgi:exopolysaccharide biosynthesis polyprenyl glycosylphosphotransferase